MRRHWKRILKAMESPEPAPHMPDEAKSASLPSICLLGKTGAGKSYLVNLLTGEPVAEIGNGFEPCTPHMQLYRYPTDEPVLQFLDLRGVGEVGYDPAQDLDEHGGASQVVIAVSRVDDPAQDELCEAVRSIPRLRKRRPILVVHNRADAIVDPTEREAALKRNHTAIERAAGRRLGQVLVGALDDPSREEARRRVFEWLAEELPRAAFVLKTEERASGERREFAQVRMQVVQRAITAGAAGAIPAAGLAAVPAVQAHMLRGVARHYDIEPNRTTLMALSGALGAGGLAIWAAQHFVRQAGMLIPIIGPAAGAATAFAATFALGRASAYYFFHMKEGRRPDVKELRRLYRSALKDARHSYRKSS